MERDKERLYFIVKSYLMGQFSSVIFLIAVLFLGVINFIQSVIIGTIAYVSSLAVLRFFDKKVDWTVRKILKILDRHEKFKKFILKYL